MALKSREPTVVQRRIRCGLPSAFLAVALIAVVPTAPAQDAAPELASGWTDKAPVASRRFMVAAANPIAVEAGYRILKQGGSAVDAAVAVQLVLNLVEPHTRRLGGRAS